MEHYAGVSTEVKERPARRKFSSRQKTLLVVLVTLSVLIVGLQVVRPFASTKYSGCNPPVAGLASLGDSKEVTIEVVNGRWPDPVLPRSGWRAAESSVPSWVTTDGRVSGTATVTAPGVLLVDFGEGHEVEFRPTSCQ